MVRESVRRFAIAVTPPIPWAGAFPPTQPPVVLASSRDCACPASPSSPLFRSPSLCMRMHGPARHAARRCRTAGQHRRSGAPRPEGLVERLVDWTTGGRRQGKVRRIQDQWPVKSVPNTSSSTVGPTSDRVARRALASAPSPKWCAQQRTAVAFRGRGVRHGAASPGAGAGCSPAQPTHPRLTQRAVCVASQSAGAACPDVTLIDYKTGEEKSLAEIVGNGKPTVIDFCAEHSLPLRRSCARQGPDARAEVAV